jgi:hypothetical protein
MRDKSICSPQPGTGHRATASRRIEPGGLTAGAAPAAGQ